MFTAGELNRRRERNNQLGGQRQGGISTPSKSPLSFSSLVTLAINIEVACRSFRLLATGARCYSYTYMTLYVGLVVW